MHEAMAATLDTAVEQIKMIQQDARVKNHQDARVKNHQDARVKNHQDARVKNQQDARVQGNFACPRWPMIVLNSPKGWTGPKIVDGLQVEGSFRSHQVPLSNPATHPE